jgi:hypothetical protein
MSKKNGKKHANPFAPTAITELSEDHPGFELPPERFTIEPTPVATLGGTVIVELPAPSPPRPDDKSYRRRFHKVELRLTDRTLQIAFTKLYFALHDSDTRLANGLHIDKASDVLRYLLEQYDAATAPSA